MASPSTHLGPDLEPDVMNDPTYETNTKGKGKSMDEADTCRICRAEGSKDEPLFYPCKCSGSIKFVHQDCLMEWLSHSQKKHCELCKTPFRFTKLYDPGMPSSVPLPVFLRQAAMHTMKTVLTWSRFHLVLLVWLGWLPWCMRTVWRGLFWIGDGGWLSWHNLGELSPSTAQASLEQLVAEGTTPAGHTLLMPSNAAASAVIAQVAKALPQILSPVSQTLNSTAGEPTVYRIVNRLIRAAVGRSANGSPPLNRQTPMLNTTTTTRFGHRSPSLFSEIVFLKTLTPWETLNSVIIDTLEGQLITLFVVIAFILIFLIREWVVQQGVNLGPGFAGAAEGQAEEVGALQQLARQHAEDRPGQPPQVDAAVGPELDDEVAEVADPERRARNLARPRAGRGAQPRANVEPHIEPRRTSIDNYHPQAEGDTSSISSLSPFAPSPQIGEDPVDSEGSALSSQLRPAMPDRDAMARVTEIRRTMEEQPLGQVQGFPGRKVFMELWQRADRRPDEVLRIIEEEDRGPELAWVVAAMTKLQDNSPSMQQDYESSRRELIDLISQVDKDIAEATTPGAGDIDAERGNVLEVTDSPVEKQYDESQEGWQFIRTSPTASESGDRLSQDSVPRHHLEIKDSRQSDPGTSDPRSRYSMTTASKAKADPEHAIIEDRATRLTIDTMDTQDQNNALREATGDFETYPQLESLSPESANSLQRDFGEGSSTEASVIRPSDTRATDITAHQIPSTSENVQHEVPFDTVAPRGYSERLIDWLWGGVTPLAEPIHEEGEDDEHVVQDFAEEAPFVPVVHGQPVMEENNAAEGAGGDPGAVAAGPAAVFDPNDAEAVEEGEDLEGIMELIGMQGPLAGLVQNGMFSAVLVSTTVFVGIWIPYIYGKLVLVVLANPIPLLIKLPLRWMSTAADLVIDVCVLCVGFIFYWVDTLVRLLVSPVGIAFPFMVKITQNKLLAATARSYAESALARLAKLFVATGDTFSNSDIPVFSIVAHEALHSIEDGVTGFVRAAFDPFYALSHGSPAQAINALWVSHLAPDASVSSMRALKAIAIHEVNDLISLPSSLLKVNPLRITLDIPQRTKTLDYSLAYWNSKDRIFAITLGYLCFSVLGAVYLKASASLRGNKRGEKVPGAVADMLYQAGGVLKVILIISIEMIVFPLYCGLLLDVALLPLFENSSVMSRVTFTLTSPNTSLFVHWFVGTCYMFHFALFVSMCRKIMRNGVLYFIRDPDDPTFHPVRDVLERNVSTQLRKIAFSALVYGGLVIVCLGGVVWGLGHAFDDVFPIHWSSNEPVLEFPVDLLFYNFLMPLAVKFFRPSDGLNKVYNWWFRRCARVLRLTQFLFGDRREDEEGHYAYYTWWDWISPKRSSPQLPAVDSNAEASAHKEIASSAFMRDGRYVRAPASDQVRIPKDARTFIEVDDQDRRIDGQPDCENGLHGRKNTMFAKVYVPPLFRLRIGLFVLLIWLFAATTGVGITLIPLIFGRHVFAYLIPNHLRMNDIYAFSIGIYLLGGTLYTLVNYHNILTSAVLYLRPDASASARNLLRQTVHYSMRLLRLFYTYVSFAFLLPALFALVMEFYLVIPLHTYFGGGERHIIHFIQDWTLGVLYVKMAGRLILWNRQSRPAEALRAIVRQGWLNPDVRLATRSFIFPATVLMCGVLVVPLPLGWLANRFYFTYHNQVGERDASMMQSCIYRYSYPAVLGLAMFFGFLYLLSLALKGWRQRIRDEVYLIGERLHNFGERRAVAVGKVTRVTSQG
ncbi:MAG: RING finger membrane [Lasallia pustulata]|uniref:RING-type E3 ubiquitin transferase n=1 Tax=Lasallia pustulata TaxID=136370 RepID=A0A5M8PSI3_9LECA|nr:MAG: RING finger membrane [Lasallia pustulata]